jgi:hypothetical protein
MLADDVLIFSEIDDRMSYCRPPQQLDRFRFALPDTSFIKLGFAAPA